MHATALCILVLLAVATRSVSALGTTRAQHESRKGQLQRKGLRTATSEIDRCSKSYTGDLCEAPQVCCCDDNNGLADCGKACDTEEKCHADSSDYLAVQHEFVDAPAEQQTATMTRMCRPECETRSIKPGMYVAGIAESALVLPAGDEEQTAAQAAPIPRSNQADDEKLDDVGSQEGSSLQDVGGQILRSKQAGEKLDVDQGSSLQDVGGEGWLEWNRAQR